MVWIKISDKFINCDNVEIIGCEPRLGYAEILIKFKTGHTEQLNIKYGPNETYEEYCNRLLELLDATQF